MAAVTNPDIQFFQALVKHGLDPYTAEQATRRSADLKPALNHAHRLLCGCQWSNLPGYGFTVPDVHDALVAAGS
jgi:hypothetical protein